MNVYCKCPQSVALVQNVDSFHGISKHSSKVASYRTCYSNPFLDFKHIHILVPKVVFVGYSGFKTHTLKWIFKVIVFSVGFFVVI